MDHQNTKLMDVAIINRMLGISRGGGEMWDLKMAEHLRELGVEVTFYLGKPLRSDLPDPPTEFDYIEIPTPHLRDIAYAAPRGIGGVIMDVDDYEFTRRAARTVHDRDHDIVHITGRPSFGRYVSDLDRPVTIKMNGPPHSFFLDIVHPRKSSYSFLPKFDAVVATGIACPKIREQSDCDVTQINPGVDTDQFTPDDTSSTGKSILFVGRFVPAKNLPALLEAFAEVLSAHPGATLTLVGDGPLRSRVESKIDDLGIRESVHLPGYVGNDDLPAYYHRADVVALSSRTENHPIVLLEAMSCATPVVAPSIGWIPHMVDHERNGLLFDTQDELADHLDSLLSDPDRRREYGEHGRRTAVEGFDWSQRAKELQRLFERVCNE